MKKILSFFLILMMLLSMCLSAGAKVITVYDDWTLEKYNNDSEWMVDSCSSEDSDIVIVDTYAGFRVTYIDDHAFVNNETMETLTVPFGIVGFGQYCFFNCSALTFVTLPSSITVFSEGVFSDTPALESVNLEDTRISLVQPYSFRNSGIKSISLPNSCSVIKDNAFLNCTALEAVYLPASVNIIGSEAFSGCEKLVIHAPYGSYAITYAIAHGIDYVYSDLEAYTFKRGDADGDGDITIMDATRVQRVLAHFDDDVDGTIAIRAAMDEDRVLGIMDATRIQRQLAQFDDPYGIGKEVTIYLLPDGSIFEPDKINA